MAGAFSMATGEWVSVRSQNQMVQTEITKEARELEREPEAEARELAAIFRGHGMTPATASAAAHEIARDPAVALRFHAREELGIDPDQIASPWTAALSSFGAFAIGAFIPLLPLLLGASGLLLPLLFAAVAAFVGGAMVSRVTGRPWWRSGLEQLALALAATAVTYAIGRSVDAALG